MPALRLGCSLIDFMSTRETFLPNAFTGGLKSPRSSPSPVSWQAFGATTATVTGEPSTHEWVTRLREVEGKMATGLRDMEQKVQGNLSRELTAVREDWCGG
jgi:hypothetical protein